MKRWIQIDAPCCGRKLLVAAAHLEPADHWQKRGQASHGRCPDCGERFELASAVAGTSVHASVAHP